MDGYEGVKLSVSDIIDIYWTLFDSGAISENCEAIKEADIIVHDGGFVIVTDGERHGLLLR